MPTPNATRWNSTFDSLRVVLNIDEKKLTLLFENLMLISISKEDRQFLTEYVAITEPIAIYLDALQGEKNCFLGNVLPTIVKLKKMLNSLHLEKMQALCEGLLAKIDDR